MLDGPFTLIALIISYLYRRKAEGSNAKLVSIIIPMLISTMFLGVIFSFGTFAFAMRENYLPATIINSMELAFTAVFAFLILKQKFTIFSLASVIFSVAGGASLALGWVFFFFFLRNSHFFKK